jgi:hypothetical protein
MPETPPAGLAVPAAAAEPVRELPAGPDGAGSPGVQVVGVYCKNEHFNDPAVAYCSVCGIAMAQHTRVPVPGPRPQLGVLLLDDATVLPLTGDHVLGRMPGSDPSVAAGQARGVILLDPLVSRVHATVQLLDWEVVLVDGGSRNGTFVCPAGETEWTRLPEGGRTVLQPGTAVAVGNRQFRYHSYRNR